MRGRAGRDGLPVAETALLSLGAIMLAVIVGATAWAFATGRARPGSGSNYALSRGDSLPADLPSEGMFADLGTLRAPTADEDPSVVVVTPVFAYDPADVAFREELVAKKAALRSALTGWFTGKTKDELARLGDAGVKTAILVEINGILETGAVSRLFFTEYAVLD